MMMPLFLKKSLSDKFGRGTEDQKNIFEFSKSISTQLNLFRESHNMFVLNGRLDTLLNTISQLNRALSATVKELQNYCLKLSFGQTDFQEKITFHSTAIATLLTNYVKQKAEIRKNNLANPPPTPKPSPDYGNAPLNKSIENKTTEGSTSINPKVTPLTRKYSSPNLKSNPFLQMKLENPPGKNSGIFESITQFGAEPKYGEMPLNKKKS